MATHVRPPGEDVDLARAAPGPGRSPTSDPRTGTMAGAGNRALASFLAVQREAVQREPVQREEDEETGDDETATSGGGDVETDAGTVTETESATETSTETSTETGTETGTETESATETPTEGEPDAAAATERTAGVEGETATEEDVASNPADDAAQAVLGSVDPSTVRSLLRQDAAARAAAENRSGVASAAGDDGTAVQTLAVQTLPAQNLTAQRDTPPGPPAPPRAGDASDILDALLALKSISDLLDRIADLAVKEIKKAGAPATIVLGSVVVPTVIIGLNQGAGVTKLVLKTPDISLGQDRQGVKRSIKFKLSTEIAPTKTEVVLGAEVTF